MARATHSAFCDAKPHLFLLPRGRVACFVPTAPPRPAAAAVPQVLLEKGRAVGVQLRGGGTIKASKAVISNASIWDTPRLLPAGALPEQYMREARDTPACPSFMHLHIGFDATGLPPDLQARPGCSNQGAQGVARQPGSSLWASSASCCRSHKPVRPQLDFPRTGHKRHACDAQVKRRQPHRWSAPTPLAAKLCTCSTCALSDGLFVMAPAAVACSCTTLLSTAGTRVWTRSRTWCSSPSPASLTPA